MLPSLTIWRESYYALWVEWRYARVFTEIGPGDWLDDLVWC